LLRAYQIAQSLRVATFYDLPGIPLPKEIDIDKTAANLDNGILKITAKWAQIIPKPQAAAA